MINIPTQCLQIENFSSTARSQIQTIRNGKHVEKGKRLAERESVG